MEQRSRDGGVIGGYGRGVLILVLVASGGCSNIIPIAADHGPVPLDSARAVAIARRNVCGAPGSATDAACVVRSYERTGGRYVIVVDRHPPAGSDRLAVTLRDNGMRAEVTPLDSVIPKPR